MSDEVRILKSGTEYSYHIMLGDASYTERIKGHIYVAPTGVTWAWIEIKDLEPLHDKSELDNLPKIYPARRITVKLPSIWCSLEEAQLSLVKKAQAMWDDDDLILWSKYDGWVNKTKARLRYLETISKYQQSVREFKA